MTEVSASGKGPRGHPRNSRSGGACEYPPDRRPPSSILATRRTNPLAIVLQLSKHARHAGQFRIHCQGNRGFHSNACRAQHRAHSVRDGGTDARAQALRGEQGQIQDGMGSRVRQLVCCAQPALGREGHGHREKEAPFAVVPLESLIERASLDRSPSVAKNWPSRSRKKPKRNDREDDRGEHRFSRRDHDALRPRLDEHSVRPDKPAQARQFWRRPGLRCALITSATRNGYIPGVPSGAAPRCNRPRSGHSCGGGSLSGKARSQVWQHGSYLADRPQSGHRAEYNLCSATRAIPTIPRGTNGVIERAQGFS